MKTTRKALMLMFLPLLACLAGYGQQDYRAQWDSLKQQQFRYDADWQSLKQYRVPAWYRDAKFGIFIHWGLYAVPAFQNEWYPYLMYRKGTAAYKHQIETYGALDSFGYKDFIPMFKAQDFNAMQWAKLFRESGARYVIPVAEHHDGFAMYKTSLSRWNAYDMGPHRDIVGELAKAVRKEGLIFGVSSHRAEHWFYFYNGRLLHSDVNDPRYADFYGPAEEGGYDFANHTMTTEFLNDWLLRCTELVDKYHPSIFWFDQWIGSQPVFQPYLKTFASYYYNHGLQWGQDVVINYKYESMPDSTAVLDIERGKEAGIRPLPWQTDDAVGFNSWGYVKNEHYKSPQYLVDELVDIVSKNGNLLLNIGPRADGTIPEEQQQLLLDMGKWLAVNGEAIYGTRPWKVFGEGPAKSLGGDHIDRKVEPFTQEDIRFTTKGDTLYAITLAIPDKKVRIRSLSDSAGRIAAVSLVGSDRKISWKQDARGLEIAPLKTYPSPYAAAFRITFQIPGESMTADSGIYQDSRGKSTYLIRHMSGIYQDSRGKSTYLIRHMNGFKVLVATEALQHPQTTQALSMLGEKLAEFPRLMDKKHLQLLQRIPVWMEWETAGTAAAMCFHPDAAWLAANGYPTEKTKSVEISDVRKFIAWQKMNQPYMVLHEFAHGYDNLALGFENKKVEACYRSAVAAGKYGEVAYSYPADPNRKRKAYAATNVMEYFAETTEAYLGRNDFYPFNRSDLKSYDPRGYRLMQKVWGK